MALFMLLIVPLPYAAKRKIFTYATSNTLQTRPVANLHHVASSPSLLSFRVFSIG